MRDRVNWSLGQGESVGDVAEADLPSLKAHDRIGVVLPLLASLSDRALQLHVVRAVAAGDLQLLLRFR